MGIKESFKLIDDILLQAIGSISNVILSQGENDINIDFVDIKTVMRNRGLAFMGVGYATGTKAACTAAKAAIKSPLLNSNSINDATGILVLFEIHPEYPTLEIAEAMDIVEEYADEDAYVTFGTTTSNNVDIDEVKITIIATGFEKISKIISSEESIEHDILNVPTFPRRIFEVNKMETINILWDGPFSPNNIGCSDIPTFLRRQIDIPDINKGSYSGLVLYLVYNLIGTEWKPLYIGMVTNDFYETHAKEWDIGSGQDMNTLMIYRGTLLNESHISLEEKEAKMKKAEALLNNILVDSPSSTQNNGIGENTIFLRNLGIEERLYPLLKSKYYWEDGVVYDIVRKV